ncbi:MAG: ATP-binding protein [Ginsengibacter sp.]
MNQDNLEETYIELNEELENYFRNTIIPQLFVDAQLKLRKFTPPAMKQYNLSSSDIGKSVTDLTENFRFPSIIENIQQVIDTNQNLEKEIQTTDLRWYQMDIVPYVTRKDNKTNGVIITFVEITMRIRDLKEQETLIADYETLLDTISHDIKTPLTSLILAIDVFKNMSLEDAKNYVSFFGVMENSVRKMEKIIRELTETRKEDHKYKSEVELLNLEHILEDVRLTLADNFKESGAVLKTEVNQSEITFSRRKLRSVIYNLVNNAIKFKSPDVNPVIHIKSELLNDYMVISVRDNGIGIDQAQHSKVFSKYARLDNHKEGSGIGLHLVKEIVQKSGGKIELESELGKGSTFKVFLKISQE